MAKKKPVKEVVVDNTEEMLGLAQQIGGLNELLRAKSEEFKNIQAQRDEAQKRLIELKK